MSDLCRLDFMIRTHRRYTGLILRDEPLSNLDADLRERTG